MSVPVITNINVGVWGGSYDNASGGQTCTITGTNLSSATSVFFGGTPAAILTNSATQITCTTPAGTPNTLVHVSVTTSGGTSSTTPGSGPDSSAFWYCPQVVLQDLAWNGIHYLPSPTVTLKGISGNHNGTGNVPISTTATTWTVVDGDGTTVASGAVAANAAQITVATAGTWASGGAVVAGHYTVYTGSGSAGVAVGTFDINPPSNLYVPN